MKLNQKWVKDPDSQESFIHVCEGKTLGQMKKKGAEIRKHDVSTFMLTIENGRPSMDHIKFCPYCGFKLDQD